MIADLASLLAAEKFWILDPLYVSLGTLLAWFFSFGHSYGLAILLLTVVVRLVTLPLTVKQARSQQELQRLQPELKRIQAKHRNDRQKLNEEMMKFYKENHVNPFGGCLPLVVQFPILIVLYRLILGLINDPPKHVPRTSAMYADLVESGGEMVSFGMDLAKRAGEVSGGAQVPFLILIALVMATGYYQQRQMMARLPKESRNSQMVMIGKIFPIMFGVISWTIPAAVVVYFLVSNTWQIGQQAVMFRKMPLPQGAEKGPKEDKDRPEKSGAKGKADPSSKKGAPTPKRSAGGKAPARGAGGKGRAGKGSGKAPAKGGAKGGAKGAAKGAAKDRDAGVGKGTKGAKPTKPVKPARSAEPAPKGTRPTPAAQESSSPTGVTGASPAGADGNGQGRSGRRRRRGRGLRPETTAPTGGNGAAESGGNPTPSGGGSAAVGDAQKDDE